MYILVYVELLISGNGIIEKKKGGGGDDEGEGLFSEVGQIQLIHSSGKIVDIQNNRG